MSKIKDLNINDYRGSRSAELFFARQQMAKARLNFITTGSVTGPEVDNTNKTLVMVDESKPGEVLMDCNNIYNLHEMLANNIKESSYYQSLSTMSDHNKMIDEIYNKVTNAEPWSTGTARTPSTLFCILMRMFDYKLTYKQLETMLDHTDSPYIRCAGFLYLRYAYDLKNLYDDYFVHYLNDEEEFSPSSDENNKITMGKYVKELLQEQKYFGSMLPRIPIPIQRDIDIKILEVESIANKHETNERYRKYLKIGVKTRAQFSEDNKWYNCKVSGLLDDGTIEVTYDPPYGNVDVLGIGRIDFAFVNKDNKNQDDKVDDGDDLAALARKREKDKVLAVGKDYAAKPGSYKRALSLVQDTYTARKRSRSRSFERPVLTYAERYYKLYIYISFISYFFF